MAKSFRSTNRLGSFFFGGGVLVASFMSLLEQGTGPTHTGPTHEGTNLRIFCLMTDLTPKDLTNWTGCFTWINPFLAFVHPSFAVSMVQLLGGFVKLIDIYIYMDALSGNKSTFFFFGGGGVDGKNLNFSEGNHLNDADPTPISPGPGWPHALKLAERMTKVLWWFFSSVSGVPNEDPNQKWSKI